MDIVTGVTIAVGIATVCGTTLATVRFLHKPDETWRKPLETLENRVDENEKELHEVQRDMVKAETQLQGIGKIENEIRVLDKKIDNLTNTILTWIQKKSDS